MRGGWLFEKMLTLIMFAVDVTSLGGGWLFGRRLHICLFVWRRGSPCRLAVGLLCKVNIGVITKVRIKETRAGFDALLEKAAPRFLQSRKVRIDVVRARLCKVHSLLVDAMHKKEYDAMSSLCKHMCTRFVAGGDLAMVKNEH